MENTIIIHESNKTVRFKLDLSIENKPKTNWSRRKAKRYHAKVKNQAVELINELRIQRKVERKRAKQRDSKQSEATIVVDSAATSTVIRTNDAQHVNVLPTKSTKVFYNANGTTSKASNRAELKYNLRVPANEADMVPGLEMNSLLSTSKLADANYITIFTKDKLSKVNIEGEVVMKG